MTLDQALKLCEARNFVATRSDKGVWAIGFESENGMVEVLGMGTDFIHAVKKAVEADNDNKREQLRGPKTREE